MAWVSPFEWLCPTAQKRALLAVFALAAVLQYAWSALDRPLHTSAAPKGILSFEVAGTPAAAQGIVASWGHDGQLHAAANLGLDYLFLLAYSGTIGLACVVVAGKLRGVRWLFALGLLLAWLQLAAALFDAVENYALIRILLGAADEGLPALARWSAMPKFILGTSGIVYVVAGIVVIVVSKLFPRLGASLGNRDGGQRAA